MNTPIRILVADEQPIARVGLRVLFGETEDMEIVAEADNTQAMVAACEEYRPDIVLLDLCTQRHKTVEAVGRIRREFPDARFVIYTTFRGPDEIALALQSKMHGYVLKTDPPANLLAALRAVREGRRWISPSLVSEIGDPPALPSLTEREREVLAAIASGKSNAEAANALFISEGTVKFHVNNILNKLGAGDRTEAVVIGLYRGLLRLSEPD